MTEDERNKLGDKWWKYSALSEEWGEVLAAVDAVLAKESSPTKWGDIPLAEFGVMPNKYAEFFDAVAYEYALQRITRKN